MNTPHAHQHRPRVVLVDASSNFRSAGGMVPIRDTTDVFDAYRMCPLAISHLSTKVKNRTALLNIEEVAKHLTTQAACTHWLRFLR
jgi:hypothetical protein